MSKIISRRSSPNLDANLAATEAALKSTIETNPPYKQYLQEILSYLSLLVVMEFRNGVYMLPQHAPENCIPVIAQLNPALPTKSHYRDEKESLHPNQVLLINKTLCDNHHRSPRDITAFYDIQQHKSMEFNCATGDYGETWSGAIRFKQDHSIYYFFSRPVMHIPDEVLDTKTGESLMPSIITHEMAHVWQFLNTSDQVSFPMGAKLEMAVKTCAFTPEHIAVNCIPLRIELQAYSIEEPLDKIRGLTLFQSRESYVTPFEYQMQMLNKFRATWTVNSLSPNGGINRLIIKNIDDVKR